MSPSSQRVWIEIELLLPTSGKESGRPLHRGCGLKLRGTFLTIVNRGVALYTEGVDWNRLAKSTRMPKKLSPSSQRVWIEIFFDDFSFPDWFSRPLHRGCGLKFGMIAQRAVLGKVALFTEGVDWNWHALACSSMLWHIALFTEGVDWN